MKISKTLFKEYLTISQEEQRKITDVIIKAATMLLDYGAESRLIEQISTRLGKALGCSSTEISLIPSAIVLTTLVQKRSYTTTRRAHNQPINMSVVHQIVSICILAEKNPGNLAMVENRLASLHSDSYPVKILIPMIGLACAAFSHLHGSDWNGFFITFLAASIGMGIRLWLSKLNYSLLIVFASTAFICTIVASLATYHNFSNTSNIVLSSSVLLLVPGFPYINSFLDAFKGYLSMGWGRWMEASLLTFMTSLGIILAMSIFGIKGW